MYIYIFSLSLSLFLSLQNVCKNRSGLIIILSINKSIERRTKYTIVILFVKNNLKCKQYNIRRMFMFIFRGSDEQTGAFLCDIHGALVFMRGHLVVIRAARVEPTGSNA